MFRPTPFLSPYLPKSLLTKRAAPDGSLRIVRFCTGVSLTNAVKPGQLKYLQTCTRTCDGMGRSRYREN